MKPPPEASTRGSVQYKVRKQAFPVRSLIPHTHFQDFSFDKIIAPGRWTLTQYRKTIGVTEIKVICAWTLTAACCALEIGRKLLPTWPVPDDVCHQSKEAWATSYK